MKKLFFAILFLFSFLFSCFPDSQIDVLFSGLYYNATCKGSAFYQLEENYSYTDIDGEYRANYSGAGGSLGFDLFFNSCPFGIYFRGGLMGCNGVTRTAGGQSVTLDNNGGWVNILCDVGGVYAFSLNDFFSLCAAPAVSLIFVNSEYYNFDSYYSSAATSDSLLGVGFLADVYGKLRYKYFVAAAGCALSFYPFASVTSSDSDIDYSRVRDPIAYIWRPYVSIGFTFREHTASHIMPAN